jgi:small subunit ribosomal protein S6
MNHYETVFILNPVLSEVKETVSKFEDFLTSRGAEMVQRRLGPKKWLTKFKKQKSGFTTFRIQSSWRSSAFETEFRRDERVAFLTVSLDKHAISWLKEEELN